MAIGGHGAGIVRVGVDMAGDGAGPTGVFGIPIAGSTDGDVRPNSVAKAGPPSPVRHGWGFWDNPDADRRVALIDVELRPWR